jgi:hypothetical protein
MISTIAKSAFFLSCYIGYAEAMYRVYTAVLSPLGTSTAKGEVTIFATSTGLLGVGTAESLQEPNLRSLQSGGENCTSANGCGVHVHSGTACTDAASQGGHFYTESLDPWSSVGYSSTTADGKANFSFSVTTAATTIQGKPFVVHDNTGSRVACGVLTEVMGNLVSAELSSLGSSGVAGRVLILTTSTRIIGAGYATGLEANLKDNSNGGLSCTAQNGCGVHVHSGTACTDSISQGGHYYKGAADPWSLVRYSSTTATGGAEFVFSVMDTAVDVSRRAFVVHDNAGGRVACGVLQPMPLMVFTAILAPLGNWSATGDVSIFVTAAGLSGIGNVKSLPESGLLSEQAGGPDCLATNGCGVHVHTGTDCTNSTSQGGHFHAEVSDPWSSVGYSSTSTEGTASFSFAVETAATQIQGKAFIVHNNAGARVACGLLSEVLEGVTTSNLDALDGSGVTGDVTIYTTSDKVIGAGYAEGLEPDLKDSSHGGTSCTATNGCGAHVHSGTSCEKKDTQGGHYYTGAADPWATVRYGSTTGGGRASFIFSVSDGATDVSGKPFIVHNDAGGRVACGRICPPTGCQVAVLLSGTPAQSSIFANMGAVNGRDEDFDSMVHTIGGAGETNPWWQLDLGGNSAVGKIRFLNRPGECGSRLFKGAGCDFEYSTAKYNAASEGAVFYVSNVSCIGDTCSGHECGRLVQPKSSGHHWYEVDCSEARGRYVSVTLPGSNRKLNFMEMEVYSPGLYIPRPRPSTVLTTSTTVTIADTTTRGTTVVTSTTLQTAASLLTSKAAAAEAASSPLDDAVTGIQQPLGLAAAMGVLAGITLMCLYCCCRRQVSSRRKSAELAAETAQETDIEGIGNIRAAAIRDNANNALPTLLASAEEDRITSPGKHGRCKTLGDSKDDDCSSTFYV